MFRSCIQRARTLFFLLFLLTSDLVLGADTIIKGVSIVDTVSGRLLENQTVILAKGKIQEIRSGQPSVEETKQSKIIDLDGAYLLPGLIDAHTHLCWDYKIPDSNNQMSIIQTPTAYRALQGARNARDMLNAGFTSVRDLGNAGHYADVALKKAINKGLVPGPNMMVSGRIISTFGGQQRLNPENSHIFDVEYYFADTRDELKKAIRKNIHYGVDLIKFISSDQRYAYSLEDMQFIVDEARAAGLDVAAHAYNDIQIKNAILAGVRTIEHGTFVSDKTLALMAERKVYFVTTTFPIDVVFSLLPGKRFRHRQKKDYASSIQRLGKALELNVPVVFGSDVITSLPNQNRGETALSYIDSFLDAGATPLQIIQAMTVNAAGALNKENEIGQIKEGYSADLIAVSQNPLKNIETLKNIRFVMRSGKVIKNTF